MLADTLYNFYMYINNKIIDIVFEILDIDDSQQSSFTDIEIDELFTYANDMNIIYNMEHKINRIDSDNIILIHDSSTYIHIYKIRENFYITMASYEKGHKCVRTMSELYDTVIQFIIFVKINRV